jgi:site-specific recombinase XerC
MGLMASNPCDAVERPRTVTAPARGLSPDQVRSLLAVVPDTMEGRRDRAILLTFILTGRRRAEVMALTAGDITVEDGTPFYAIEERAGSAAVASCPDQPSRR